MAKKIAVLVNEDTMQRCSCGGCLKAFMNKADSFERYADEDIENYESIAEQCAEAGFDVVGYTHGGAVSKDGKEAIVLSAKPVTTDQ